MRRIALAMAFGAVSLLALFTAQRAWSGAVSAAGKNTSKVILENKKVRVKEVVFAPGDAKPGMHTHTYPHVGVVIDGGTLKFNYPDGKSETLELARGAAGYRDANVTHEAVNLGMKPVRVIEVEIK